VIGGVSSHVFQMLQGGEFSAVRRKDRNERSHGAVGARMADAAENQAQEIFLAATDQNLRKLAKYGDRAPPTGSPPTGPRQKLVEPFKTQTRYRSRGVAAQMSATKTPDETEHRQSTGFPTQSNRK